MKVKRLRNLGLPAAAAAAFAGTACDDVINPVGCTLENYEITDDTTFTAACSPYVLTESLVVKDGATLTIEPGTEVRFPPNAWLEIASGGEGKLVSKGTAAAPILLTSTTPDASAAGTWLGVMFRENTLPGSVLEHTTVRFAGQDAYGQRGCVTAIGTVNGAIKVANTTFDRCDQAGIHVEGGSVTLSDLTFKSSDVGLTLAPNNVGDLKAAMTYQDVKANQILAGDVTEDATWVGQPIPFKALGSLVVRQEAELTLSSGVTLRFNTNDWMEIASGGESAKLVAQGGAQPVVFESVNPETAQPGSWLGIMFRSPTLPGSKLDKVVVRHAGQDAYGQKGCVTIDGAVAGSVTVTNSTFEQCKQSGLAAHGSEDFTFAEASGNRFVSSESGMWLAAGSIDTVATQTYEQVPFNIIEGGKVKSSATWEAQGIPWKVSGGIEVEGSGAPELTIQPGSTFEFETSNWIEIGSNEPGGLVAVGTATDPIVFQSQSGAGASGAWLGLMFRANTVTGTKLEHVTIRHAGQDAYGQRGCVTVVGAAAGRITLKDSTFESCGQSGVAAHDEGFEFTELSGNTFKDCESGVWLHPSAVGSVAAGQVFETTPYNRIAEGTVRDSATWYGQAVGYRMDGDLDVDGPSTPALTLAEGLTLAFGTTQWIEIGAGDGGALNVQGTPTNPVIFESSGAGGPGAWLGIVFRAGTAASSLTQFTLRDAGQDAYGARGGISLFGTGNRVSITNGTFEENEQAGIYVDCDSTPTLSGNSYSGNGLVRENCGT